MMTNEEKQIARQRRERKFRLWLMTLSWTMPIIAFGSFFSIWHHISSAVNPSVNPNSPSAHNMNGESSRSSIVPTTNPSVSNETNRVLFKIGSRGPQVSVIQEQLQELGYFNNHVITEYYGPVTAQAVEAFQKDQHLNVTGEIDIGTLNALRQAVKLHRTSDLVGSSAPSAPATNNSVSQSTQWMQSQDSGSVTTSQQIIPQTHSSASRHKP